MMLYKLVTAMDPLGYRAGVVTLTEESTIGQGLRDVGIPVVALNCGRGVLLPSQVASLVRTFHEFRPEVVHAWMYHANVVGQCLVRMHRRRGRPALVTSIRGSLDAWRSEKLPVRGVRRIDALLSARAAAIVFNSNRGAAQHAALGYCMDRATVIPNCFDTELFRPRLEAREALRAELGCGSARLIGFVARFDPLKDHRNFLRMARLVAALGHDYRFVLVGLGCDRNNRQLMKWVREDGLEGLVFPLGERRDVPQIQAALDLAVSSSMSEGFPNAVGEAMACGIPCVVTDVGDCQVLVGDAGIVVPPRNPVALAKAVLEVMGMSAERRNELGDRGRRRVIGKFGMASIVDRFAELYRTCLQAQSRRGNGRYK